MVVRAPSAPRGAETIRAMRSTRGNAVPSACSLGRAPPGAQPDAPGSHGGVVLTYFSLLSVERPQIAWISAAKPAQDLRCRESDCAYPGPIRRRGDGPRTCLLPARNAIPQLPTPSLPPADSPEPCSSHHPDPSSARFPAGRFCHHQASLPPFVRMVRNHSRLCTRFHGTIHCPSICILHL